MNLLNRSWKPLLSLLFGLCVFLFWWKACPAITAYHEQFQLFLMDSDYVLGLLGVPDGLARVVAEFLVQFYINHALAALVLAVALVLMQWLTWCLMKRVRGDGADIYYMLSFIPSLLLWLMMGDESLLLTFAVAMLMAMAAMWLYELTPRRWRPLFVGVSVPVLYWVAGPVVLMYAAYVALRSWQPGRSLVSSLCRGVLAVAYAIGCIVASAWIVPYPMFRLFQGLDYYRFPEIYSMLVALLMALCVLLPVLAAWLPTSSSRRTLWMMGMGEALALLVAFILLRPSFYDARKYEAMEYDYLVRCNRWDDVIAKAETKTPDLPMTVCATNLALAMKGQLGERAFDFFQNGVQGLLPAFERNFSTLLLTGEAYWQMGLVNTSQRYAFEAMEAIPNYAKSSRAVKRLAETNMVNGQYAVARKYLHALEKTVAYRQWARRTLQLLESEKAIDAHPVYGKMRKLKPKDDLLFSEGELDKIMGQLMMHNSQNSVALQYLLLYPLLERDVNKFMSYMTYVDGLGLGYRPRSCQEAVVFAMAQRRQQPPQGYVSPMVMNQFADFARTYSSGGANSGALERFKHTTWYYLTVGK